MTTEKLSVSFGSDLAATVRSAAADEGSSVSTWLANAAEAKARSYKLRRALDADAAEQGPLSDADVDRLIAKARSDSVVTRPNPA